MGASTGASSRVDLQRARAQHAAVQPPAPFCPRRLTPPFDSRPILPSSVHPSIPSDADFVLRIDPATCTATEIGPEIGTRATHCHISHNCNKWQNGFLAPDGLIYAIPLKASAVLRVDPLKDEVDVVGGPFLGFEKWEGGVLSRLGAMYCIPLNSKQILKINPKVRISKDRKGQKRRVNDGKDKLGW